jgi:hypothetical protein
MNSELVSVLSGVSSSEPTAIISAFMSLFERGGSLRLHAADSR